MLDLAQDDVQRRALQALAQTNVTLPEYLTRRAGFRRGRERRGWRAEA